MHTTTQALVLRIVKYSDTSVVCTLFTHVLGVQSYIVKGINSAAKYNSKATVLQPANIILLSVVQNPHKPVNFLSDFNLAHIYKQLYANPVVSAVLMLCTEICTKFLRADAPAQPELFDDVCAIFKGVDALEIPAAHAPVFLLLCMAHHLGCQIPLVAGVDEEDFYFDWLNNQWVTMQPAHTFYSTVAAGKFMQALNCTVGAGGYQNPQVVLDASLRIELTERLIDYLQLQLNIKVQINALSVLKRVFL